MQNMKDGVNNKLEDSFERLDGTNDDKIEALNAFFTGGSVSHGENNKIAEALRETFFTTRGLIELFDSEDEDSEIFPLDVQCYLRLECVKQIKLWAENSEKYKHDKINKLCQEKINNITTAFANFSSNLGKKMGYSAFAFLLGVMGLLLYFATTDYSGKDAFRANLSFGIGAGLLTLSGGIASTISCCGLFKQRKTIKAFSELNDLDKENIPLISSNGGGLENVLQNIVSARMNELFIKNDDVTRNQNRTLIEHYSIIKNDHTHVVSMN